jgi:hypothetical protein
VIVRDRRSVPTLLRDGLTVPYDQLGDEVTART